MMTMAGGMRENTHRTEMTRALQDGPHGTLLSLITGTHTIGYVGQCTAALIYLSLLLDNGQGSVSLKL